MSEGDISGLEYGVVVWVLAFLAVWWGVVVFLWKRYWPRLTRRRRKRRERRSQQSEQPQAQPHEAAHTNPTVEYHVEQQHV
jgi:flagellar biosynthesis/type III secretory pathway M-ring protein FliF/YscJ